MLNTTRRRVLDGMHPTWETVYVHPGDGSADYEIVNSYRNEGTYSSIDDVNHPNWRELQKQGIRTMGDVSVQRISRSYDFGEVTDGQYGNGYTYRLAGDLARIVEGHSPGSSLDFNFENWIQIVLAKAYAKANSGNFMLGENLSELGKSVEMLRSPLKGSLNLLKSINRNYQRSLRTSLKSQLKGKSGKIRNTAGSFKRDNTVAAAKALASAELEMRYGMTPLFLDFKEAIKVIHEKRERCDRRGLVARSGQVISQDKGGAIEPSYGAGWPVVGSYAFIQNLKVMAGVFYDVESRTKTDDLLAILGLRGRDLIPTLWEVTPLSFVADWFVNVGDWLQAITPVPGTTFRESWVTTINSSMSRCSGSVGWPSEAARGGSHLAGSYGGSVTTAFNYSRNCKPVLLFRPVPTVRKLSALKQVDGLSLLVQQIIVEAKNLPRR